MNKMKVTPAPVVNGKSVLLPSGKTAVIKDFKGKHVREAATLAGDNPGMLMYAMIALCVTIDGEPVVMEDMDEMPGKDVLTLQKEFTEINF